MSMEKHQVYIIKKTFNLCKPNVEKKFFLSFTKLFQFTSVIVENAVMHQLIHIIHRFFTPET